MGVFAFDYSDYPDASTLRSALESIPKKYLDLLELDLYQIGGTVKHANGYHIFEQFEAHYAGYKLSSRDSRTNTLRFWRVFYSMTPELDKYHTYQSKIKEGLHDFDNTWVTVSTSEGKNKAASVSNAATSSLNLNKNKNSAEVGTGSSDANSGGAALVILDGKTDTVEYNTLNKTKTVGDTIAANVTYNDNKTDNATAAETANVVKSSNLSEDYITFLAIEIPRFKERFLNAFAPLFFYPG